MKDFRTKLLGLIDNGASQAKSLIESFNDVVDSFDMNAQIEYFNEKKKELIKRGNDLFGDFADLLKQVKESITDFSVTVPFDESIGEKISYEVKNGKLEIEVSYRDETHERNNKTSVLIPSNCDLEQISFKNNPSLKVATITIPKKIAEPIKEETAPTKKPKKTSKKKKAVKKANENVESNASDSAANTHVGSKLAQKLKQNSEKYSNMLRRDSNGRFVRRTPNN